MVAALMGPLRLRIDTDGEHVLVERPAGGGWGSDGWELVARLDRLQAANLCADLADWLAGGTVPAPSMLRIDGRTEQVIEPR